MYIVEGFLKYLETGSQKSESILEEYIENLKLGLGNLIDIFEPEAICLGGSFSYYEELFLPRLEGKIKTFNERKDIKIVTAKLQNTAGIIGATIEI